MDLEAEDILYEHPSNHVDNLLDSSDTKKEWTKKYDALTKKQLRLHSRFLDNGAVEADWSPFAPPRSDDLLRRSQFSTQPNPRAAWSLGNEDDMTLYLYQEVVAVVLSKFKSFPPVTLQAKVERGGVIVDWVFKWRGRIVLIAELKRNLIQAGAILDGTFEKKPGQMRLLQELRGYAIEYECPQIFCFDGNSFLGLQFRAHDRKDFFKCGADGWLFPRTETDSHFRGYPLRDAIYRFIVQGIRRCQSDDLPLPKMGSLTAHSRMLFSGEPRWRTRDGKTLQHPEGYSRDESRDGVLCWCYSGQWIVDQFNQPVSDCRELWQEQVNPPMRMEIEDDIYGDD